MKTLLYLLIALISLSLVACIDTNPKGPISKGPIQDTVKIEIPKPDLPDSLLALIPAGGKLPSFYVNKSITSLAMFTEASSSNCDPGGENTIDNDEGTWRQNWINKWVPKNGERWDLKLSDNTLGPNWIVDRSRLPERVGNYDYFRIYFGFVSSCTQDENMICLFYKPLDDNCNPVAGCPYMFQDTQGSAHYCLGECPGVDPNTGGDTHASVTWAADKTKAFRELYGLSDEAGGNVYTAPSGDKFTMPLAFTYSTESFLSLISTEQTWLYAHMGLNETAPGEYELKLIFKDDPNHPNTIEPGEEDAHYVDFAAPCPQVCGTQDAILGI